MDTSHRFARQFKVTISHVEFVGLLVIALATLIALGKEIVTMFAAPFAITLGDLLLLFIYLEVLAMVTVYADSGKLPVRMPMYIAIVALARYLVIEVKTLDAWQIVAVAAAIFLIAAAVFVFRYSTFHFPSKPTGEDGTSGSS